MTSTSALASVPVDQKRYEKVLSCNGPRKAETLLVLQPGESFAKYEDKPFPPRAYNIYYKLYGPGKVSFHDETNDSIRRAVEGALHLDAGPATGGLKGSAKAEKNRSREVSLEMESTGQIVILWVDGTQNTCCSCCCGSSSDSSIDVDIIVSKGAVANAGGLVTEVKKKSIQEETEHFVRDHPDHLFTPHNEMQVLWTPIHEMAYQSRTDLLTELLRTRPGLLSGYKGYTPLHSACRKANLVTVMFLVEKEPSLLKIFGENKYSPLHSALRNENQEERKKIVSYLLQQEPDLCQLGQKESLSILNFEQLTALCEALPSVPQLRNLDLRRCQITSAGAAVINKALLASSSIQVLLLGDNTDLKEEGIQALQEGLARICLKEVSLKKVNMTDLGARYLAESLQRGSLTKVDLSHNLIGDTGAVALAGLLDHVHLEDLNLWGNKITDEGAFALYEALQKRRSSLKPLKINLMDNALTERAKSKFRTLSSHKILLE